MKDSRNIVLLLFIFHTAELKKKQTGKNKGKSTKKKVGTTDSKKKKDDGKTKKKKEEAKKETANERANRLNKENKAAKKAFGKNIPLTPNREMLKKCLGGTQSYLGGFVGRLFGWFKKDKQYKAAYEKWATKMGEEADAMGLKDIHRTFHINEARDQYWFVDPKIIGLKKNGYSKFMAFAKNFEGWNGLGMTKQLFHLNIQCYNALENIVVMLSLANQDKDIALVTKKWFKKYIDVENNAVNIGSYKQELRRALESVGPKKRPKK